VRHEMLKAQNSLVMMVLKMCGTGIFVRKHAVSSPQVRVLTANLTPSCSFVSFDLRLPDGSSPPRIPGPTAAAAYGLVGPCTCPAALEAPPGVTQPVNRQRQGKAEQCSIDPPTNLRLTCMQPQVRVIIGGASLMFDRFRLSQALLLQAFNFLTFVIMEVRLA
jgi:hypothetical protein